MIRAARRQGGTPARGVCCLRDILGGAPPDQRRHDDRARWLTDRYFDAVLVHADPGFARLEDSFRPTRAMRTPVHHTGYVVPARERSAQAPRGGLLPDRGGPTLGGGPPAPGSIDLDLNRRRTEAFLRGLVGNMDTGPNARGTGDERADCAR